MLRLRHVASVVPLLAGLAIGLGAIVLLHVADRSGVDASAATAAAPDDAIAAFVQANGDDFAGPCEATRSPEDIGKVCARKVDERGDVRAYLIGRTFSEFNTWVFVGAESGGYAVIASEALDFHDMSMTVPWPR